MKIIIAPDSFKGSLSAEAVADAIEKGLKEALPDAELIKIPLGDGGEGTARTFETVLEGKRKSCRVMDPIGREIDGYIVLVNEGKTAIVEMAVASGLSLLADAERNPMVTSTYGTGQLIKKALEEGVEEIIVTIGGSATNDGGMGMMGALGAVFLNCNGKALPVEGRYGKDVAKIDTFFLDPRIKDVRFKVLYDVGNPFYGPDGASLTYSEQKGANAKEQKILEESLTNLGMIIKRDYNIDLQNVPGSGAAGGLGGALFAFFKAEMVPGIEEVLKIMGMEEKIADADLIITGEGMTDGQSINGKAPVGVARMAKKYNIPVIILSGALGDSYEKLQAEGVTAFFNIQEKPSSLAESMANSEELLYRRAKNIARICKIL